MAEGKFSKGSVYRTCAANELEGLTSNGWRLVDVIQGVRYGERFEGVAAFDEGSNGSNSGYRSASWQQTTVQRLVPEVTIMFLLEKNEGSAVSELEARATKACAERDEAKKKAEEAARAQNAAEAKAKDLQHQVDRIRETYARESEEHKSAEKRHDTLRHDMAKIKDAIGALKMEEILGRKVT